MTTRYAIWCKYTDAKKVVRESWFKEAGVVSLYATEKAAADIARELQLRLKRSPFHTGTISEYEARAYDEIS